MATSACVVICVLIMAWLVELSISTVPSCAGRTSTVFLIDVGAMLGNDPVTRSTTVPQTGSVGMWVRTCLLVVRLPL